MDWLPFWFLGVLDTYIQKNCPEKMKDETIYHIYAKDRCLYPCLREEEFIKVWSDLQNMVGLMKTDYTVDDLSFVECPPDVGGNGYDDNLEPSY